MKKVRGSKAKAAKGSRSAANLAALITQKEAAAMRGVTQAAIGDLIRRGRLKTAEMFGKVLVYRSEVEDFQKDKPGPKIRG